MSLIRNNARRIRRRARYYSSERGPVRSYPRGRRIGLIGFYGWGNYGDELFIDAFAPALGRAGTMTVLPELESDPYFTRPVRQVVAEQDALVIGGGDLVQFNRRNKLYWDSAYLDKPVFIYGVGVPTWRGAEPVPRIVDHLRQFFQHPNVKYIGVRDEESKAWIDANLEPTVEVKVHADLVFSLDLPPASRPGPDDPPILGIVTRQRPVDSPDDYTAVEALARTAQDRGFRIRHIVLGTGTVGQRDLANADDLDVPGKELVHSENLDDLSRWIGECRVLASMKFHGTVVATMYGTPSICLMPTPKNYRLLKQIGRPELIRHFTHDTLFEMIADEPPALIDPATVAALRDDSRAGLDELTAAIERSAPITSRLKRRLTRT
jgi:polysaccharide pyruvyl transferase WcaK-like protein